MMQWFAMHGYAPYIWSAYGCVLAVLVCHGVMAVRGERRTWLLLKRWLAKS